MDGRIFQIHSARQLLKGCVDSFADDCIQNKTAYDENNEDTGYIHKDAHAF